MASQTKDIRQATRTLQTLRGTGQVYSGSDLICEGRYTLMVQQGIVYAGSQPSAGVTNIKGTLVTVDGQTLELGTRLSLEMEDGRTAAFIVATDSSVAGMYGIHVNILRKRPPAQGR
jgi:hypothetical protein